MKRLILIPALVPALVLLPVLLVWYLNIGGVYKLIKSRSRQIFCSADLDCPPGHVCIDGRCVPAN